MNTMCGRDLQWRRAQMLHKQPSQLPRTKPQPIRQLFHIPLVQRPFQNQPERPRHYRRCPQPRRSTGSRLRLAALAGAKSSRLRRGRAGEQNYIPGPGKWHRAYVPAIEPGRRRTRKKTPIESRIAAINRLPADLRRQRSIAFNNRPIPPRSPHVRILGAPR